MPIDSAANLIMSIGAETGDAEANVQRFRSLLGKDLDDLGAEFSSWSTKVFGNLGTVQAGMLGVTAAAAAGLIAIGAAAIEASEKYRQLVEQIESGTDKTGISAEQMSQLKLAADMTGTSYDSLVRGLTLFETATVKAGEGSQQQAQAFQRLGITQAQLADGERDIVPLLANTMDRMQGLASGTERAAIARDLFGRGGAEMMEFLRLGSVGLKQMADEAEHLGVIITEQDIRAMKELKSGHS